MNTRRVILAALLTLSGIYPAVASGPYAIRRAADPAELASTPVLAWSSSAIWDDVTVPLDDGRDWYYSVEDLSGAAVSIRIEKNEALRCVRLIAASAPVALGGRDAAIATIQAIGGPTGMLASIAAASDPSVSALLVAGRLDLADAIAMLAMPTGTRDNLALKRDLEHALRDLLAASALATTERGAIDAAIEALLAAARAIAIYHVSTAEERCGPAILEARSALREGDAALAAGNALAAVDAWARAIERAWQAPHCG